MKSFNDLYVSLQRRSRNSNATQLLEFKKDINTTQQLVLSQFPGKFLEKTSDLTTVASQQAYELPIDCRNNQIMEVEMVISTTLMYRPKIVESAKYWEYLLSRAVGTSDVTQFVYIYDEKIYLWPTPTTASYTTRVRHRKISVDMNADDYVVGNVLTATLASAAIVGDTTPTVWSAGMAGRYLRITKAAAANKGDGFWYEITSVTDGTHLTLVKPYAGTSVTVAAAYTIGEMPVIPEPYQDLLVYRPLMIYYTMNEESETRARLMAFQYDGGYELGLSPRVGGLLGKMMDDLSGSGEGVFLENRQAEEPSLSDLSIKNYDYTGETGWGA